MRSMLAGIPFRTTSSRSHSTTLSSKVVSERFSSVAYKFGCVHISTKTSLPEKTVNTLTEKQIDDLLDEELVNIVKKYFVFVEDADPKIINHEIMFAITNFLIQDVIEHSQEQIKTLKIKTFQNIANHNQLIISFSKKGDESLFLISYRAKLMRRS